MHCERVRLKLNGYCCGELDRPLAANVERHLGLCRDCQLELVRLQALVSLFRRVPGVPVPRGFTERVTAKAGAWMAVRGAAGPRPALGLQIGPRLSASMCTAAAVVLLSGLMAGVLMGWDTLRHSRARSSAKAQAEASEVAAAYGLDCLTEGVDGSLVRAYLIVALGQNGGQD